MEYKNFDEYWENIKDNAFTFNRKTLLKKTWDVAINSIPIGPPVKVQIAEMLKGEIEKVVKHLGVSYVENSNELYNYWNAKLQTLEQIQNWIDSNLSA